MSATGLFAAYATVMGLFPILLARPPKQSFPPGLMRCVEGWRRHHWRVAFPRRPGWVLLGLMVLLVLGFSQLRVTDDIRSEEHTSELQSRGHLVCRLLLEKKKVRKKRITLTD